MTQSERLAKFLATPRAQRALLLNDARVAHHWLVYDADDFIEARSLGLVTGDWWHQRFTRLGAVRRRFYANTGRGPIWDPCRDALVEVRRSKNLTVDHRLIGPVMVNVAKSWQSRRWRADWTDRDTPAVLRQVARLVAERLSARSEEAA